MTRDANFSGQTKQGRKPRRRHSRLITAAFTPLIRWLPGIVLLASLIPTSVMSQQLPEVQQEFLNHRRQLQGDSLRFCLNAASLVVELDSAVADALADALLITAQLRLLEPYTPMPPLDHNLPMNSNELFTHMANDCDALLGFTLARDGLPEWLTITKPYYRTPFILAVTDENYSGLADIPRDVRIGTRTLSQADIRLVEYLQALPQNARWPRIPYPNNELLLERLVDGSLGAVLVWAPAVCAFLEARTDVSGIRVLPTAPLAVPEIQFGIVLNSGDSQLRQMLDEAITYITEVGIVDRLLAEHGFVGQACGSER